MKPYNDMHLVRFGCKLQPPLGVFFCPTALIDPSMLQTLLDTELPLFRIQFTRCEKGRSLYQDLDRWVFQPE